MVIVELIGGLGNQMFQYALGRCLAEKMQTTLKLNIMGFEKYPLRNYELNCFNIEENFVTTAEIKSLHLSGWEKKLQSLGTSLGIISSTHTLEQVMEKHFHYDPSILQRQGDLYLSGYWQSEKYFKIIEHIIRREFTLRRPFNEKYQQIAESMKKNESVAIHIRRGDYISNSTTNEVHGVMSVEYYHRAMGYLESKLNQEVIYYLFSDDVEWVRNNFGKSENLHIIDNDISRSYEDMLLMSCCRHHIIANSSFSWWGAWLNDNDNQIVIAPKLWFAKQEMDTRDLIPNNWIRV